MSEIPWVTSADRVTKMLAYDPWSDLCRAMFPEPQVTSRDIQPMAVAPAPVMKLAEFAREHSWEVRTQYSQGNFPHSITGRPGALKDVIGVRFGAHPVTDRQAYAIYARNASGGTWSWESFMVWGPDLPPAKLYLLAELQAYLMMAPDSDAEALKTAIGDFKIIYENGKALAKQRAKARPAKEREGAR